MSHLAIDTAQIAAGKLTDFNVGTLVLVPTQTQSVSGPFWALRFDENCDEGVKRSVIWLNGTPWHGPDPAFYGMPLAGISDLQGIACGTARIEVDVASGSGREAREMRWDQSAGYIAVNSRGTFLVGEKERRGSMFGACYAIDVSAWADTPEASDVAPVEWFGRWNVVIETGRGPVAMSFKARSRGAGRAA